MKKFLTSTALAVSAIAMVSSAVPAQESTVGGAVGGAVIGGAVGGPVGAAVGATAGAAVGGIADDARPRFRSYVTEHRHPSFRYQNDLRVGVVLPENGITYHEVPREYGATGYRYTIINDRTVLVDPGTRRVVQVID